MYIHFSLKDLYIFFILHHRKEIQLLIKSSISRILNNPLFVLHYVLNGLLKDFQMLKVDNHIQYKRNQDFNCLILFRTYIPFFYFL